MLNEYIFAGGRMIAREGGSSGRIFFLNDRLSARATITDGNGNIQGRQSHLPFGEELVATGTTDKHRFTSYERDSEAGTDYAVNRQYAQGMGRFNRPDSYSGSYNPSNPQSFNRYVYGENDAVNRVDPSGLVSLPCLSDSHSPALVSTPSSIDLESWIDQGVESNVASTILNVIGEMAKVMRPRYKGATIAGPIYLRRTQCQIIGPILIREVGKCTYFTMTVGCACRSRIGVPDCLFWSTCQVSFCELWDGEVQMNYFCLNIT
jgi:RHS repeat-associated protein